MRGAEAFRTFYDAARAQWPIFTDPVILSLSTPNGAEFKGVDTNGRPVFWVDPNYEIADIIGFHECGHAFEALLEHRGLSKDYTRTRLWQFRQWLGTWQQQDAYARTLPNGSQQWQNLPVEIVAESWRVGHMGPPSQERTAYLGPTDYAVRGFYESLQQEAGVAQTDQPGVSWAASPNHWDGRWYGPPQYIVDHWTVINAANTIAAFTRESSGVSAHYLVCRDGRIVQFVREGDTAWHDGYDPDGYGPLPGWNHISIGIEHEHELWQTDWPQAQLDASARLHRDIRTRTGIPLTSDHVLGHRETGYATACPGDLPIDRIIEEDDMFTEADRAKLNRVYDVVEAREDLVWTQRLQDWLSKVFKSFPVYARPTDFSGPDVTKGTPRT